MILDIVFLIGIVFITIRTVAYGIYSIRETGICGGISVLVLAAANAAAGWIVLYVCKGV